MGDSERGKERKKRMLLEKMYVRCPIDHDMANPRDFLMGQIVKIDRFADTVGVVFQDPFHYGVYYENFPKSSTLPAALVQHCQFFEGSVVSYGAETYTVVSCSLNADSYHEYYLENQYDRKIVKVTEDKITAPFTVGKVDPASQLAKYEFQNPCWIFGRSVVMRTMNILDNSIYGFKELAGCKIFLMPHQLKSVMRCLQGDECRYMLADEVGMGKTIEAASIIKVYFSRHCDVNALIVTPSALLEQWKMELFLKFNLSEGENENNNYIKFVSMGDAVHYDCNQEWDFVIVDEAHRILLQEGYYEAFHRLSKNTANLLLLSATPVQQRREDYLNLLRLIMPDKYDGCTEGQFAKLIDKQGIITKAAAMVLASIEELDDLLVKAGESGEDPHNNEDSEDYFDDIQSGMAKLYRTVGDDAFRKMYEKADFDDEDVGIHHFKIAISYFCDTYQIERNIIRNRRDMLEHLPARQLKMLPYQLDEDRNFYEYRTYQDLVAWITEGRITDEEFESVFRPLFGAFFSSPWAFEQEILRIEKNISVPDGLKEDLRRWKMYEQDIVNQISDVMDDPDAWSSRIAQIMYYLDEYVGDSKVVLFTNYQATYEAYRAVLTDYFTEDGFSCFRKGMSSDELELNVYRFQNDRSCTIMLCDESGGEGRNFQCADYVVHIDLPWDANTIEQRIGRLDRMGREEDRPVISVVPYAQETLEEELLKFWNRGLGIFEHSLSGLEIIMNDINKAIVSAIIEDFRFGLANEIENVIKRAEKLKQEVREEQHFDTSAYIYRPMNQQLISLVNYYNRNENQLFADAMLQWARLSGFHDVGEKDGIISFNEQSFSTRSAENSLLIPPNWMNYLAGKQSQFMTKVKELQIDEQEVNLSHYIGTIEGTFNRKKAIENDYIHFFAPGDAVFDCIVDNALRSCRGQSAAFAMKSDINWRGFIYTWSLCPNEKLLLDKGISRSYLGSFRNYLAVEQVQIPVRISSGDDVPDDKVIREFNRVLQRDIENEKDDIDHLGRRGKEYGFLGIYDRYRSSNIEYFKMRYPQEKWENYVKGTRKESRQKATQILKRRSRVSEAKVEMNGILTSLEASEQYYGQKSGDIEKLKEIYDVVWECLSKPMIRLESACFVWMVRQ